MPYCPFGGYCLRQKLRTRGCLGLIRRQRFRALALATRLVPDLKALRRSPECAKIFCAVAIAATLLMSVGLSEFDRKDRSSRVLCPRARATASSSNSGT